MRGADSVLRFEGAARTYPGPPEVAALRPFDLTVARGEFVTVVGPSGSGKSTLLNVAGLLDRPTAGRYWLDGIDVASLPERSRTALRGHRIGLVFQAYHLLATRTVLENVMLAGVYQAVPHTVRRARATEALDRVGLGARAQALAGELSGGERQRVAIARAVVHRPSLLLCDEPTGNLDSVSAAAVLGLLAELHAQGMTLLLITHDRSVAATGQRCIAIHDGVLWDDS